MSLTFSLSHFPYFFVFFRATRSFLAILHTFIIMHGPVYSLLCPPLFRGLLSLEFTSGFTTHNKLSLRTAELLNSLP